MPRVREFRWRTDKDAVLGFQEDIYETNFPGFHMSATFLRDYEAQIRRAARHPGEKMLVLEDELGICGFAWLTLITTMVEPFVGYLKNIYVAPRLRGQGHGQRLLRAAHDWFRSHGCTKATLDASVCNTRAVEIYCVAGYEPVRYRMEKLLGANEAPAPTEPGRAHD